MGIALFLTKIEDCGFYQTQYNHFFYQTKTTFFMTSNWPLTSHGQISKLNILLLSPPATKIIVLGWSIVVKGYNIHKKKKGHYDAFWITPFKVCLELMPSSYSPLQCLYIMLFGHIWWWNYMMMTYVSPFSLLLIFDLIDPDKVTVMTSN